MRRAYSALTRLSRRSMTPEQYQEYRALRGSIDACTSCQKMVIRLYLIDGECLRCANINEPCVYRSEPRGAFGIAGGWCDTHDAGWNWCEHTKSPEGAS